ncbi:MULTISPECIES: dicarboxylate/amino acid:cation symporter [unclassified Marinobacter]|uniref:dicarboxylate/amino acid:cation symporter n=1 Tax=unclassified Marinobacter TaxID=83889 RepID=UPI0026E30A14|nr:MULTISPECIES: dicarboxylate/amino acid:cation symporter [unclassified Marinobacter]MDO6442856.1 dicarboxylate/amino acid:cation symporter [Marinobacter sp. 2_MG-2023]MDO6822928.1 dicarboxylate/amino acid:cation symporter [Marinobacter sp. 1_MG-2023]
MKSVLDVYLKTSLVLRIGIALVLGLVVGLVGGPVVAEWLNPFGELLLKLLKFLIVPIVLFTLMVGINQADLSSMGRVGRKLLGFYVLTSALAIAVGLGVASLFEPGSGLELTSSASVEVPENPGFVQVLLNIVPANIVEAFAQPNLLGIIFTAIVFGIALLKLRESDTHGEAGAKVYDVVSGLNDVTMKVMAGVLQYVPIGVFAIVATTAGEQGMATILALGDMVMVLYIALAVQLAVYAVLMRLNGVGLADFIREARAPVATAFATQSSSGTLPLTLNAARRMGIPQRIFGFSLPLGATINMDGAGIRIAISAVFAANVVGVPLDFVTMLEIVLIGTLASIGTAGVPGAGIVMIATVFAQVGLPIETVALLVSIDALVGMGATAMNVTGDLACTSVIARSEQKHGSVVESSAVPDKQLA